MAQEAPEPPDHRIDTNMRGILYGSREGVRIEESGPAGARAARSPK